MSNLINNGSGNISKDIVITEDMFIQGYLLSYDCSSIGSGSSYILIHAVKSDTTVDTYFMPVQFKGHVEFGLDIAGEVRMLEFRVKGDATLMGINFGTSVDTTMEYVQANAPYWDKIKDVVSETGKLRTDMLEGIINLTVNAFANRSGTITQIDGIMTFLDGSTEANSTQAVQIVGGAIRVSDTRDAGGNWVWDVAITGAGINASAITAGILRAIDISGSTITGGSIIGGSIVGVTIEGSTIYAGNRETGDYTAINSMGTITRYSKGVEVLSISGDSGEGGGMVLIRSHNGDGTFILDTNIEIGGQRAMRMECNGFPGGMIWQDSGTGTSIKLNSSGTISLTPGHGKYVYVDSDLLVKGKVSASNVK